MLFHKEGHRLFTALMILLALPRSAGAAYNQPVTWADMNTLDLRPVFKTEYATEDNLLQPTITESDYDLVLRDADNRIAKEFGIPSDLKPQVEFWMRIYTQWTTQHVVIFDSQHPEIVYSVLDFRELAKKARNRIVYEIISKKKIRATMVAFRKALVELARNPAPKHPTPVQQSILKAVRKIRHEHKFSELAKHVRAQTGQRDNIVKGLIAAESFFPRMEEIFSQTGLPPELSRLSLVESSFDLTSRSRVGAAGVWQFMRRTAKEFMIVDEKHQIDERLSPLKSTVAAARLLRRHYTILRKNWPLTITSYNHGFRGLYKIASKQYSPDERDSIFAACNKRSPLGWASRNYYTEFLAVLHAEAYRHLFYGEPPSPRIPPVRFEQLKAPASAVAIAAKKGLSIQQFRLYNPDIRNPNRLVPEGFWIAVPSETDDLAGVFATRGRKKI